MDFLGRKETVDFLAVTDFLAKEATPAFLVYPVYLGRKESLVGMDWRDVQGVLVSREILVQRGVQECLWAP